MKILIDCSNLRVGGGIQVAISFLEDLNELNLLHTFFVIQSYNTFKQIDKGMFRDNFIFFDLLESSTISISKRRNKVIEIERKIKPDIGFTVFGPSYHKSKFPKIVGFAIPFIIYSNSPFFSKISLKDRLKYKFLSIIKSYFFKKNSDVLIFETDDSHNIFLRKNRKKTEAYTVNNTLNTIFAKPSRWTNKLIIEKTNLDILCLSANYPHKNLDLLPQIIDAIKVLQPGLNFKFHISAEKKEFNFSASHNSFINYLGRVDLQELPNLYSKMDICFMPSLLEIFSTTYLEAMFTQVPIVSADMSFARDICENSALYCEPMNPEGYAINLLKIKNDKNLRALLIQNGKLNLERFGTSHDRTIKYLEIITKTLKFSNPDEKSNYWYYGMQMFYWSKFNKLFCKKNVLCICCRSKK